MGHKNCTNHKGWKENQKRLGKLFEKRKEQRIKEYLKNPKRCKYCNKIIPYEEKRKQFCNHSCSASFNNSGKNKQRKREKTYCINCNTILGNQAKYCSRDCQIKYEYKVYIEQWKKGEISGTAKGDYMPVKIRRYIFEKFDRKCTKCGWSKINSYTGLIPLHVDHVDGNSENNKEENLDLLCPSCHSLTPNYGSLNKGNSKREYRNKWRKKHKELMGV